MQELEDLRRSIVEGRTADALEMLTHLDFMSRKATIHAIDAQLTRALMHLVKMDAEKRLTNSWRNSIRGSLMLIKRINLMDNGKSYYVHATDWQERIHDAFIDAISDASTEVFDGKYKPKELKTLVNRERIQAIAQTMLAQTYTLDDESLGDWIDDYLEQQITVL
jgi:hypothetical protein